MKRPFLKGILLGILLAMTGWAAAALLSPARMPPLTADQVKVAERLGFQEVKIVKEIKEIESLRYVARDLTEAEMEEIRSIITERIRATIEPEVVDVIKEIAVPVNCPDVLQGTRIGGGCEITIVGSGGDRMAQAIWSAWVKGGHPDYPWSLSRGPVVADSVEYEVVKESLPPRWGRTWWLSAFKLGEAYGVSTGPSFRWRRYSLRAEVGLGLNVPGLEEIDLDTYRPDEDVDLFGQVSVGRSW